MKKFFPSLVLIVSLLGYTFTLQGEEAIAFAASIPSGAHVSTTRSVKKGKISKRKIVVKAKHSKVVVKKIASSTGSSNTLHAQGIVRIVSTYGADQTLIRTTRLRTSDGKLYRLAETVTVPANGEISVSVYADKTGAVYAIGPSTFIVPGLPSALQSLITGVSDGSFTLSATSPVTSAPAATPVAAPVQTLPPPAPVTPPAPTPAPVSALYKDGQFIGASEDAYYGNVQVKAIIQGGKISDVQFLDYPQDRSNSIRINTYAMPNLTSEAIQSQNPNVDIVSGATATSQAFQQSLASALAQAKN